MIPGNTASQGKYVDPPTSVTASAGDAQATISFTLPVYDGKQVATYVATSSPSGITGSGASSPITVTGLSNGTAYTFTVTTISGYGVSATSVASNSVTPVAPTTTTTTTPDPCAGPADCAYLAVSCAQPPPGGSWTYLYTYNYCVQNICGPHNGVWESYAIFDYCGRTCCTYGLFKYCTFDFAC